MRRARNLPLVYIVDDQAMFLELPEAFPKDCGGRIQSFEDPVEALKTLR